ncbi:hypothetical protein LCGC14_2409580, partial [marine sediment metagenome]
GNGKALACPLASLRRISNCPSVGFRVAFVLVGIFPNPMRDNSPTRRELFFHRRKSLSRSVDFFFTFLVFFIYAPVALNSLSTIIPCTLRYRQREHREPFLFLPQEVPRIAGYSRRCGNSSTSQIPIESESPQGNLFQPIHPTGEQLLNASRLESQ